MVATIKLESYLGSINSTSSTQRDPTSAVSVVSPVVEHEPLSDTLKLLNERLEKLEVQLVSHSDLRTRKPQGAGACEWKTVALTCWNCGKREYVAQGCWSHQNPTATLQGNFKPFGSMGQPLKGQGYVMALPKECTFIYR